MTLVGEAMVPAVVLTNASKATIITVDFQLIIATYKDGGHDLFDSRSLCNLRQVPHGAFRVGSDSSAR